MLGVNHVFFIDVKVKRVVGVRRVVRVTAQRFFPADDLAHVLNQRLTFGQVLHGKNALAMHAGAARLDATTGHNRGRSGRSRSVWSELIFGHV